MADPLWMEFESTSGAERKPHQISVTFRQRQTSQTLSPSS